MIPMHAVPSALIARNESWVRKQASALVRHLPANVEKADLIQVGLIAVAQAAMGFEWAGDRETEAARDAFVRYARLRVKGAMLDELRQMDYLGRSQRRKVKVIQIARERWRSVHGCEPGMADLSRLCGLSVDEIGTLEQADMQGRAQSSSVHADDAAPERMAHERFHPATAQDEVEARVDTAIVMRRLESFFAQLPQRERQIIDSYMGVGLTPSELASSLRISRSRVSQLHKRLLDRIAKHFGQQIPSRQRRLDGLATGAGAPDLEQLMLQREHELQRSPAHGPWGELIEAALTKKLVAHRPIKPATAQAETLQTLR